MFEGRFHHFPPRFIFVAKFQKNCPKVLSLFTCETVTSLVWSWYLSIPFIKINHIDHNVYLYIHDNIWLIIIHHDFAALEKTRPRFFLGRHMPHTCFWSPWARVLEHAWAIGYGFRRKDMVNHVEPHENPITFTYYLFSSLFGEMSQFDEYFSDGLKPPTR